MGKELASNLEQDHGTKNKMKYYARMSEPYEVVTCIDSQQKKIVPQLRCCEFVLVIFNVERLQGGQLSTENNASFIQVSVLQV